MVELEMKVLVVNDSGLVGGRLVEQLAGLDGVEVLPQAFNAIQASVAVRETLPDVVLLDPQLPAGTSRGVLRDVREKAPRARVLVLATSADEAYRRAWIESGADDCITAATDLRALLAGLKSEFPPS